ncbi:T9SS type A sorting domain-containing protein [Flavobacterium sp. GA093]|uniref:T9SS type A sorting domain-containing protein n=1 Tax=Flavobacterium hydrocarbonoxydans TaxID=2683249 RepID=A0A6I4NYI2_9FLAO|nr:T9SS type A sorting domain-containing protein [Flavobacterium hydrocarbonoxydans]
MNIQSEEPILTYKIYDVLGRLLYESKPNSNSIKTDWSSRANGIYYISVSNENGKTTKKIIKQ